jgi:predicted PurR-regulated permease PerM
MYNNYLYLIFIPLFTLCIFVIYKFIFTRFFNRYIQKIKLNKKLQENINSIENIAENVAGSVEGSIEDAADDVMDNLLEAKIIILNFLYDMTENIKFYYQKFYAFFLHFLVLIMKFFRDFTDNVYARSRDKFLETATKEKSTVNIFWKHLKEYKKEADKEEREENK